MQRNVIEHYEHDLAWDENQLQEALIGGLIHRDPAIYTRLPIPQP